MTLQTRSTGDVAVLELAGRFDAHTVPAVAAWLEQVASQPAARVVVDLKGAHFIDSMALAALVRGLKRCREHGGDLRLCDLQQPVRIIFELTRLDAAFLIYPTANEAIESFRSERSVG